MSSRPADERAAAKALEKANKCILVHRRGVWECWSHGTCPSLRDGKLLVET